MASERARRRCREQVVALSERPGDPFALRFGAVELMRAVIGFDRWCWPVCDPASGLGTTAVGDHDYWDALPRLLLLDQRLDAPDALPALTRARSTAGPDPGLRFRDVLEPTGIGDELRVPLRDRHGLWGCLDLMRSTDDRRFDDDDRALLDALAPALAALTRRSTAASLGASPTSDVAASGVIILDEDLAVRACTPSARSWIAKLAPPGMPHAERAASGAFLNVASRVLARADAGRSAHAALARTRVRTITGIWGVIEADTLDTTERTVAVTIRPATAPEILDLRVLAYDLTKRECQLVSLLLAGHDTRAVSATLFLSPHTVQDHLKSIFEKTGVHTRKELVAQLSRAH
jgi:DNA-binding CsgD family transcriptional regulator